MTHMQKLTFSSAERAATRSDPVARSRNKMLAAIEAQMALIRAEDAGETYVVTKRRWVTDPDTKERLRKDVERAVRPWFWRDEKGGYMLEARYGNRPLPLKGKQSAIEVGKREDLIPTLETLHQAVGHGEIDAALAKARQRARPGKK